MAPKQHFLESALTLCIVLSLSAAQVFDYVIVGAGTCGLTVANRLSEDPNVTVAVIDPGDDQRGNTNVTTPALWTQNYGSSIDWAYPSLPQVDAANRTFSYHAGRGIGGTSLVNGMTYIRGDKAQFDAWEQLGNAGWNWDSLFARYIALENFTRPAQWQVDVGASYDQQYHGTNGPLHVGFIPVLQNNSLESTIAGAWQNLSLPVNRDVNSGTTYGFDVWPQTLDAETDYRWDAATAFYWPVQHRKNLKLITGTAIRATWAATKRSDGLPIVSGVEYIDANNQTRKICASREVIVSAGALRSSPFLEMSGIGNPSILANVKPSIPVVVDLPAVGENLQDQPNTLLFYNGTMNITGYAPYAVFAGAQDLFGDDVSTVAAATNASIPAWAQRAANASGGALHASALEHIYRIQHDLIFNKNVTIAEMLPTAGGSTFLTAGIGLLPFSRGSVHLSSPDSNDRPLIDPKFLLIDHDLQVNIALNKLCRRFFETEGGRSLVAAKTSPTESVLPDNATDAQWEAFVTGYFAPNFHPIGTNAMMSRELGGVVDPQLKVYGTSNLRVVDASVVPTQFSGHLTATLYAIADRAADMIMTGRRHGA